jgi:NAD(P)-dependent dehydrogenase (short-subunit alcohol dehydrogenase family)
MTAPLTDIFSLKEKDFWVFGGAGHLGQATVSLLCAAGAKVLCVDLEDRSQTFAQTANLGDALMPATSDVRDISALRQFVGSQLKQRGVPHGLAVAD